MKKSRMDFNTGTEAKHSSRRAMSNRLRAAAAELWQFAQIHITSAFGQLLFKVWL